jgi:hypothetical protein
VWLSAKSNGLFYWVIAFFDGSTDALWSLKGYNARVTHTVYVTTIDRFLMVDKDYVVWFFFVLQSKSVGDVLGASGDS